jgi:hypothetical protein
MKEHIAGIARIPVYAIVLYGLYLLVLLTLPYLSLERNTDFLRTKQAVVHHDYYMTAFWMHIFSSPVLVLSGLFQFSGRIIARRPRLHRVSGKIYVIVLLFVSAPGALVLAWYANGYLLTKLSFLLLTGLWIVFSILGYIRARQKRFEAHGNFLLASYMLALSAITLRFYAYLIGVLNIPLQPKDAYLLISLLSWIPNLAIAWLMIRAGFIKGVLSRGGTIPDQRSRSLRRA